MKIFFEKRFESKNLQTINNIYFQNIFFLFNLIIFISLFYQINSTPTFTYSTVVTLLNGNFFIIHKKGVDIYDSSLTEKIKSVLNFTEDDDQIKDQDELSKTTISRFSENDNGLIVSIIKDKIFIFSYKGDILYKSDDIIEELKGKYYTLVPIKKTNNEYNYLIGFINDDQNIQLLFFKYDDNDQTNKIFYNMPPFSYIEEEESYPIKGKGLSCQLMKYSSLSNLIVCFYSINIFPNNITLSFIDSEKYSLIDSIEKPKIQLTNELSDITGIKSAINKDLTLSIICFFLGAKSGYCFTYSINSNTFSEYTKYLTYCKSQYHDMKINYMRETNKYIFSCTSDEANTDIIIFDENFQKLNNYTINNCNNHFSYSIVYSYDKENYFAICESQSEIFRNISDTIITPYVEKIENLIKTPEKTSIIENICQEKCLSCNEEISKDLCLSCNTIKNYYPINPVFSPKNSRINNIYMECYNNLTKPKNFYLNKSTHFYEPCYSTCATCEYGGDGNENNCTSCDFDYMKEPEIQGTTNCVALCKNYYYYTSYGQFKCSSSPQCPDECNLLIRDKKKCIDSCLNDEEYKFQYNGECLKLCPVDTQIDMNDHICKVINKETCTNSSSEFELYNFLKEGGVEKIAKTYSKEFNYTNKHISIFKNEVYSIMLYKDKDCISELGLPMPEIDFGECYKKVQKSINITNDLIVAIIDKSSNKKSNPITSYSFYNPIDGEKLDSETLCKEEVIIVKENIKSLLNDNVSDINSILFLADQNIDVFNKSCEFYTNLCYHFESPNNKDVALHDRLLIYYPNITLCDSGCTVYGVNLTSMTAICECKYKEMTEDDTEEETNLYQSAVNEVFNILDQINLAVMSCYEDLFEYKYFITCTGGLITLFLIVVQFINIIIYYFYSIFYVKKYIFNMTENYILFLNKSPMYKPNINKIKHDENNKEKNENENAPPKKNQISSEENESNNKIHNSKKQNVKIKKNDNKKKALKTQDGLEDKNSSKIVLCGQRINKKKTKSNSNITNINVDKNLLSYNSNEKSHANHFTNISTYNSSFYDKYLSTQLNEMRFIDAVDKDKRLFFDYFCDKLKKKQVILELFLINDPIKPRTIKILLLILDIEVCFVVNAMFINEDYISKIFHSTKEENFISFLPRSINRCIYTILASRIVSYIVGCLFIEERIIKNILRYEGNNMYTIKYEISKLMKEIKWRYSIFIIITIIISFFTWFYISCFNNIYPHTKMEWVKSSLFIIILIHIISIIITLIETLLRFISFEIKSEKMYNASLWLS